MAVSDKFDDSLPGIIKSKQLGLGSLAVTIPLLWSMKDVHSNELQSKAQAVADKFKINNQHIDFRFASHYNPKTRTVMAPTQSVDVLLHELGHVNAHDTHKYLGKIRKGGGYAAAAAILGSILSDKDSDAAKAMPVVVGAAHIPKLVDEVLASKFSIDKLKEFKASPQQLLTAKKNLAKAFATYLLGSSISVATPYLINKYKGSNEIL